MEEYIKDYLIFNIKMIETELTYLVKKIPEGIEKCESKELIDLYFPKDRVHPKLRLRKKGNKYEMTKKNPINEDDSSVQIEETIKLDEEEYNELAKMHSKKVRKIRYYYDYKGKIAEIDVFQDELKGLVLVDFEFDSNDEKKNFIMPEFCLVDITQEEFIAGGMICGKTYEDIKEKLDEFSYKKIFMKSD
jgi:CYTH domain-containing protein